MIFEIDKEEQQKIDEWLREIRDQMDLANTEYMNFPALSYHFRPLGNIGIEVIVREHVTGKELDLTNIDKW